jgi:hypothetical protein
MAGPGATARSQGIPSYTAPISDLTASSFARTATKNVLARNTAKLEAL